MVKRGSVVWRYFDRQQNNRTEAKCTLCSKLIRCSGNTTNLMAHLKSKHAGLSSLLGTKQSSSMDSGHGSAMTTLDTPTTSTSILANSFGAIAMGKTALFQTPESMHNFQTKHSYSTDSTVDSDSGDISSEPINNKKMKIFNSGSLNPVIGRKSTVDSDNKDSLGGVRKFWTVSFPGNVGATSPSTYNNSLFLKPKPRPSSFPVQPPPKPTKAAKLSMESPKPQQRAPVTITEFVPVMVNNPAPPPQPQSVSACPPNPKLRIGFIGAGNIANAIASGLLNSGLVKADQIFASAPSNNNLYKFQEFGCYTTNSNSKIFQPLNSSNINRLASKSELTYVLFLCVKPNILLKNSDFFSFLNDSDMLTSIKSNRLFVVSVLAGVTMNTVLRSMDNSRQALNSAGITPTICRIMPNTACSANAGAIGLSFYDQKSSQTELVQVLDKLGTCMVVGEDQLDAVCGIAGSGIAYVYSMIQAMADGGVLSGLPRDVAAKLAAQTVAGAAEMVLRTGSGPIELRNNVCSPAGTTITGLQILERGRFNSTVIDAVEAATKKSKEFSQLSSK